MTNRTLFLALPRPLLTVLGLVFALCSTASAQTPATPPTVRFAVFAPQPVAEITFVPKPGAPPQRVQFQPSARSPRYEYRGTMPLRFVDAAGTVVAEANVPANMREALLLFTPIENPAPAAKEATKEKAAPALQRFQIAVLDDSVARQGPGGLAIINLSGLALSGTVNDEKVTLKPGLNPPVNVGRAAKIALSTVFKNKTYHSYTGNATLKPNERVLLILFPPFYKGALEVQARMLIDQPPGTQPAKRPQK